ncbi:MAG TPA: sulfite exporter TauE/SafE family protein [Methylophilaceae bacterium]|nr:sulfite exporter TauE/SafE family protein [Methylophilaceae bacterium]
MIDSRAFMFAVLVPVAVAGGFLRGFAGFGSVLFMLPVLNVFLPPSTSIGVMMWVDLFSNVQLLPDARRDSSIATVLPLMLGTFVGMPVGVHVLLTVDPAAMKIVICGAILAAAFVLLSGWRYRRPAGPGTFGAAGALSGLIMGTTAIAAATPLFLAASSHRAAENRANYIIWVFLATILLIVLLAWNSALAVGNIRTIVVLTPAYLIGITIGIRLHKRAKERTTRGVVLALVIAVALAGLMF